MRSRIVWKQFTQLGPFRWKQIRPATAARSAFGVVVPLAIGWASGHVPLGAYAALGASSAGIAAFQGETRTRVMGVVLASIGMALSTFVGATAARSGWLLVPIVAIWGYCTGLAVALGPRWSLVVMQWSIALLIAAGLPFGPTEAGMRALLVLAGGLFQAVLIAASWPLRPGLREREALADSYRALATYASLLATGKFAAPPPAAFPADTVLLDPNPLLPSFVRLSFLDLLEEAERIRASLAALAATSEDPECRVLMRDTAVVLTLIADALTAGRAGRPRLITEIRQTLIDRSITRDTPWRWAGEALLGQLRAVARIVAYFEGVRPQGQTDGDQGARLAIPRQNSAAWIFTTLRANTSIESEAGRHALRLATTAALAEALVQATGLYQGRWVTLTIFLVLRPDYASTIYRGVQRALGTAIGAGLGFAADFVHHGVGTQIVAIALSTTAMYCLFDVSFLLFNIFLTAFVVELLNLLGSPAVLTAEARFIDTFIGGFFGLAAYLAWPTWEGSTAQEKFARMIEAHRDFIAALFRELAHSGSLNTQQLRALQAAARRSRSDAEAATERLSQEPPHSPLTPALADAVIAASNRLAVAALALHALAFPPRRPVERTDPSEQVVKRLDALGTGIDTAMSRLASAFRSLAKPQPIPALRPIHDELRREPAISDSAIVLLTDRLVDAVNTVDEILREKFPARKFPAKQGDSRGP